MSLLSQVTIGRIEQPILALTYGVDGSGKSTLGATAPSPIFLGTEKGTGSLNVARFPAPKNFKEVLQAVDELIKEKHDYRTLVIDSLDWLEPLVWDQVCFDNGWKDIETPGYGKGYTVAIKYWNDLISRLSKLREEKNMNILAIAHSQVKLAKDPQNQTEYDRYQLKLNDRAAALWREFCDEVLFMNYEVLTHKDKGKVRAFGGELRYLYTERRPGFDAKNRHGLPFQIQINKETAWQDLMEAYEVHDEPTVQDYVGNIAELLKEVKDPQLKQSVQETLGKVGDNLVQLKRVHSKLREYLGHQETV